MSDIFFKELNIPKAKYNLGVGSASHGRQTGEMLKLLDEVLELEQPAAVMVYGDTNSTLAGALAGSKLHYPVIHVEAGLRSYNKSMPEEINRILTDHVSTLLFCPSEVSKINLEKEGITEGVHVVGDVMYDIFVAYEKYFDTDNNYGDYALLTMHRAENTERDALKIRLNQLASIDIKIIYPIHPRTRKYIYEYGYELPKNVMTIEPVGWMELMQLARNAMFILTDSGGLQKEALWHKKPCYTLRNETEWVETIEQGANVLIGTDIAAIDLIIKNNSNMVNPYGDGSAAIKITDIIKENLSHRL